MLELRAQGEISKETVNRAASWGRLARDAELPWQADVLQIIIDAE
jgi:hypothetical protein